MKFDRILLRLENKILAGAGNTSGPQRFTETEISRDFNVSRGTVRKAVAELRKRGMITSSKGHGIYVRERRYWNNKSSIHPWVRFLHCGRMLDDPRYTRMLASLQESFADTGLTLTFHRLSVPLERSDQLWTCIEKDAGATVIISGAIGHSGHSFFRFKPDSRSPRIILYGFYPRPAHFSLVGPDNEFGLAQLLELFAERDGPFVVLNGAAGVWQHQKLAETVKRFVAGQFGKRRKIVVHFSEREDGYGVTRELVARLGTPINIIVPNCLLAMGVYQAAYRLGLKIPEDVRVASAADASIAQHLVPQLTALSLNEPEMARQIVRLVQEETAAGKSLASTILVKPTLIVRQSV